MLTCGSVQVKASYTSSLITHRSWRFAKSSSCCCSSRGNTVPSGLDGELTISTRERSETRVSSSAISGMKPASARSGYGTAVAPSMCAFIVKVV